MGRQRKVSDACGEILKAAVILAVIHDPQVGRHEIDKIHIGVMDPESIRLLAFLHVWQGPPDLPSLVYRPDTGQHKHMRVVLAKIDSFRCSLVFADARVLVLDPHAVVIVRDMFLGARGACRK